MVHFSFIRLTISTTHFYWAPAEDAGMWTAWPLPQSVFVPVGSEDANRLGSWEQGRGAAQQGGIGTGERVICRTRAGRGASFHPEGTPRGVFPFMPRTPSVTWWQRGRRGSGVTSSPEWHCRDSLAWRPRGTPENGSMLSAEPQRHLPGWGGRGGNVLGLGERRPSQSMWGGGGNRDPQQDGCRDESLRPAVTEGRQVQNDCKHRLQQNSLSIIKQWNASVSSLTATGSERVSRSVVSDSLWPHGV